MSLNGNELAAPAEPADAPNEFNIVRLTMITAGVAAGVIVAIFLIGVVLSLLPSVGPTAARVKTLRDLFIIVMGLESILIIFALAALVIQFARLANLVQNEVKPILKNTQDTVNTAKGTAQFVSANVTEPIIKASAFMAGVGVFVREMGGIRKAMRPAPKPRASSKENSANGR